MKSVRVVAAVAIASLALGACNSKRKYLEGIGSTEEGLLNLDPESVRVTNGTVLANTSMWHFGEGTPMNEKLKAQGAPFHITGYSSVLQVNCDKRTYKQMNQMYYLSNKDTHRLPDTAETMILPESPAEKAMDFMCLPSWRRSLKVMLSEL